MGRGPFRQSSAAPAQHSHRLFTPADTPTPCTPTPFQLFSLRLFYNPGNLNRWKRVSEPTASAQIEVLSCMVISSPPWKWWRSFLARAPGLPPPPPDKELFGHLLRAQQRLALHCRKGVSRGAGVNRGQQWLGITFLWKMVVVGSHPSTHSQSRSVCCSEAGVYVVNVRNEGVCENHHIWRLLIMRRKNEAECLDDFSAVGSG